MGIPTGPQQDRTPARGENLTGRTPGNQQPAQPRQRQGGLPPQGQPQQRPVQRAPRPEGAQAPSAPQRRPVQRPEAGLPPQRPAAPSTPLRQSPPRQTQAQIPPRRPVQQAPEALPPAPDESFDDPFGGFSSQEEDLFSDVPKGGYRNDALPDDSLELEDDAFEQLDVDLDDEEVLEDEPEEVAPPVAPRTPRAAAQPRRLQGSTRAPARSSASEDEHSDEFVDRDNLKLKPFGKPKRKAKVGDFDARRNMEGQRKLYRGLFLTALVAIVGFGAYQTFWPQQTLSAAEVEDIAYIAAGDTGFPTVRGEGFALSFMDSLLNVEPGPDENARRTAALSYFYGESLESAQAFDTALTTVGSISQQVVYGPVSLDSTPITSNAASYEVGVLLNTLDTEAVPANDADSTQRAADSLRWVSFNVNVYYDESRNSFAIAPNSPSLLPAPAVEAPSVVPAGEPLGEPIDDFPESVNATVVGFLSGYRESTKTNFDKILQYIGTDADETLRDGLGSRYSFATPDDPASSIDIEVFQPGADTSELKVALTVDWQIATGENSSVTFPSHYVLTLESRGSGDYTVTKFAPYYWTEASEPTE